MRFFNTTGPMVAADHYCIPPLDRLDLDELLLLVRQKRYFVLHAPRQTGKTTALLALQERLHADGYRCVYANVEEGQTAREDVGRAMRAVLGELGYRARSALDDEFLDGAWPDLLARYGADRALPRASVGHRFRGDNEDFRRSYRAVGKLEAGRRIERHARAVVIRPARHRGEQAAAPATLPESTSSA